MVLCCILFRRVFVCECSIVCRCCDALCLSCFVYSSCANFPLCVLSVVLRVRFVFACVLFSLRVLYIKECFVYERVCMFEN